MKNFIFIFVGVVFFVVTFIMGESIIACVLIGILMGGGTYGIKKFINKRKIEAINKSYEMDLPDLMIHVAMFAEAGLGIRESLERAVLAGNRQKPLYKDLHEVFEMQRRIGSKDFATVLEELSERRKSAALSNFTAVIIQNMRKGSDELGELFAAQAQIYRNERRRTAAKLADEAATLLLIPSTIVLLALVILLLTPAVMSFLEGM